MRARLLIGLVGIVVLVGLVANPGGQTEAAEPAAPDDIPDQISSPMTDYVIQSSKIYYLNKPPCAPIRSSDALSRQVVGRVAVSGWEKRDMYEHFHDFFCEPPDRPDILSDIVSDADYVYWVSRVDGGLVRISEDRQVWQTERPELVDGHEPKESELEIVGDNIYMLQRGSTGTGLYRLNKNTGDSTQLLTAGSVGSSPVDFQTDGQYLYWLHGSSPGRNLERYHLTTGAHNPIATGVTGSYYPVAGNVVYIGFDNNIHSYSHTTGMLTPVYTSDTNATFRSITADGSAIYFIQRNTGPTNAHALYRMTFGGPAVPLFFPFFNSDTLHRLKRDGDYLFFLQNDVLKRIRTNADILPMTNMRIEGLEINQAIQNDGNTVPLIRGKQTVVRLFASSDGEDITGVTARLYRLNDDGFVIDGPLPPINWFRESSFTFVRVRAHADPVDFDNSFNFFLPSSWVDDPTLRLRVELNPFHYPPEPDYSDNTLTTTTYDLEESDRLETHFVLFEYESGGERFRPRYEQDYLQTVSWVRRTFPLATDFGGVRDATPGFRPSHRYLFNAELGPAVGNDDPRCASLRPDDRGLCAAYIVVCPMLATLRATDWRSSSDYQIGMVVTGPDGLRGTNCGTGNAVSPTGSNPLGWDWDGSYADWRTGHRLGQLLGRRYPATGNSCGHSADDPAFPWPDARIGDDTYRGFDMGLAGLPPIGGPKVYPYRWHDMMSYCLSPGVWISDYTYVGIKNRLASGAGPRLSSAAVTAGAYLQLSGVLFPDEQEAILPQVRLWDSLKTTPIAPTPGNYRIRLLKSDGVELAHYDFTPVQGEATDALLISEFVPYTSDTKRVEIAHNPSGELVWGYDVSANPPVVSNVQFVGAPSPLSGIVKLQWTATDADGDELRYDVLYSEDDDGYYQVVQTGLTEKSAEIDMDELPGTSHGRFKVIANDGLRQGEGESSGIAVARKAPTITIQSPTDGQTFPFGHRVYFAAEVYDLQDRDVDNISWTDQTGYELSQVPQFDSDNLLIGENIITVTATNNAGLTTQSTFTFYVEDELQPPLTTLAVSPHQAGWHVSDEESAPQTATLSAVNLGEGEFSVSVSEDAPWLSVSQSGGVTPMSLILTADPSYVQSGQILTANVQIVGTVGGGSQTVIVPVSLAKGNALHPPGQAGELRIFLPALARP